MPRSVQHARTPAHRARRFTALLLGSTAVLAGAHGANAQPAALQELVVTASKRPQSQTDVPASLEVIAGDDLAAARVTRIEDLAQTIPNLDVAEFSDGQYRLIYRGVGATGASDNQNFSTAVDNVIVPYGRAYRLLDLQRVEVLRGPQGTLHGRNTNAGLVNVVTEDGRTSAPGAVTLAYGSGETASASAAFGGRIGDDGVFFRLAGRSEQSDGFITNTRLGSDAAHKGRNATGRATVGIERGAWLAKLALTYDDYTGNSDDLAPLATPRISRAPDIGRSEGRMVLPVLTVTRSGEAFDVTSVTAYASTRRDLTFSAVVSPVLLGQFDRFESWSEELRLNGRTQVAGRPLEWIGGLYLLHERNPFRSTTTLTTANLLLLDQRQTRVTDAAALFGEAVLDLDDHWRITAGLRLATEEQEVAYRAAATAPEARSQRRYDSVQPKLVAAYRWGEDAQAYASVTRGFRAGSVFVGNAPLRPAAYDPESTWQYELGFKARLPEQALRLEAAVFRIDWTDMQVQRSVIASTTPFVVRTVLDNASEARSWGGEASLTWSPDPRFDLSLKGGFVNARYRAYEPTPGVSYAGNRVEMVPKASASLGAQWRPTDALSIGADVTRVGPMAFDAANTARQKPYTVLNANVAYTLGRVRLAVIGRNLGDEDYASRGLVNAGVPYVHFADPRTVTAEIGVSF